MKKIIVGIGITMIAVAVIILGMGLWEAFISVKGQVREVKLPGFHEVTLDAPGLFAVVYQHR